MFAPFTCVKCQFYVYRFCNNMLLCQLLAYSMTFLLDGFETTATVLAHTLLNLGRNKEAQNLLREEIRSRRRGEAQAQAEAPGPAPQLVLHGREVPRLLQDHHRLQPRPRRRGLRWMRYHFVPADWRTRQADRRLLLPQEATVKWDSR